MTLLLASAARATVGGRSGQEDAFRLWPAEGPVPPKAEGGGLLAVLADGMGGHTGGAIAGQTACRTFTDVFAATNTSLETRLKTALHASNEALAKGVEQNAALKGMGCTIVAAWIDDLGIRWTSVGDFAPAALPPSRCHPPQRRPLAGLVPGRASPAEQDHALRGQEKPQPQCPALGAHGLQDRPHRSARRASGATPRRLGGACQRRDLLAPWR